MRKEQNIFDFLASPEIEKAQAERFDQMYEVVGDEAKNRLDVMLNNLRGSLKGIGTQGAKFLIMRLHDYFNMTEEEQKQARIHGVMLSSYEV